MLQGEDGALWVFGGFGDGLADASMYKLDVESKKWTAVQRSAVSPDSRSAHAMVAVHGDLYLYGGTTQTGSVSKELWRFSIWTLAWSRVPIKAGAELLGGLYGHGMASVQGTATVYMFGGEMGGSGSRTNDLWCFSVDDKPLEWVRLETNWQGIAWETRPRATQYHSMSAVGDDIYIFGGESDPLPPSPPGVSEYSSEMWKFSTRRKEWEQVQRATGSLWPSKRKGAAVGVMGQFLFVHGGWFEMGPPAESALGDLWRFATLSQEWALLDGHLGITRPSGRGFHGIAGLGSSFYLLGGFYMTATPAGGTKESFDQQLWRLTVPCTSGGVAVTGGSRSSVNNSCNATSGYAWSQLDSSGSGAHLQKPSARNGHALAALGSDVYLYGGNITSNTPAPGDSQAPLSYSNELWRLSGDTYSWTLLASTGAQPSGRDGHSLVVVEGDIFLFGGQTDAGLSGELWRLVTSSLTWTQHSVGTAPSARCQHASAAIGTDMYVHGGHTDVGSSDELWHFSVTSLTWTLLQISGNKPSARFGHSMSAVGNFLIVLGGDNGFSAKSYESSDEGFYLVPWRFATVNSTWARLDNSAVDRLFPVHTRPFARSKHAMATSGADIYVHGGCSAGDNRRPCNVQNSYQECWVFSTVTMDWTLMNPKAVGTPGARFLHAMVVNSDGKLHLHGGVHQINPMNSGNSDELVVRQGTRRTFTWPTYGLSSFTQIFDEDTVQPDQHGTSHWPCSPTGSAHRGGCSWEGEPFASHLQADWALSLCSQPFLPCSLQVVGPGTIRRHAEGMIECLARHGCQGVSLRGVTLTCQEPYALLHVFLSSVAGLLSSSLASHVPLPPPAMPSLLRPWFCDWHYALYE